MSSVSARTLILAFACSLGFATLSHAVEAQNKKPNILFLIADDLRAELGCYGAKYIHSPNIDRLATRGMVMEHAYCQVAVCNPSRCNVLSGCRPDTTKVFDNQHFLRPLNPDILTLPEHFKKNGWHTVSLGKVFHHSEKEPGDDPQSWSEPSWYHGTPYRSWFSKETDDELKRLKALPEKERPKIVRGPPYEAANEPDESYADAQTATKAIETLRRLKDANEPFFLGVGFVKPHLPFTCPQKYWDLYPPDTIKLPDNYRAPQNVPEPAMHDWYELRTYGGIPKKGGITDETALNLIRGYRACISFMDAQFGRVIDELDRLGLADNTIIIFWGDNGYHLGENGIFTKMTNFELGTHVPLMICTPHQKSAGQHCKALVEYVDIYPTLAQLAGLPLPTHLEGTSFAPLLENPEKPWKKAVFSQYLRPGKDKFMGRSVRTDRWRYTEWVNGNNESAGVELYDEKNDPKENVNVADDTTYQSVIAELAKTLHTGWRAQIPAGATVSNTSRAPDPLPAPKPAAEPSPKRSQASEKPLVKKGMLLFSDDFEGTELGKDWRALWPTITVADGIMKASQKVEGHGAVARVKAPQADGVVEFKFRFEGVKSFAAVFDDLAFKGTHGGHICRVNVSPKRIVLGDDKEGALRNDIFEMRNDPARKAEREKLLEGREQAIEAQLAPHRWYHMSIEILGDEMRVSLDGKNIGSLKSPGIAHPTKSDFHFTVNGKDVWFDEVKIWSAEKPQG